MNKYALLSLFLVLFFGTKAQDKIISINHDTIYCKIESISKDRIIYEQKNNNGSVTGKLMSLSEVAEYSIFHKPGKSSRIDKVSLGLNAGISTMPWYFDNDPSTLIKPDFYNKLKTGFHINASAHYMINDYFGLGLDYSFFKTSTSGNTLVENSLSVFIMEPEKYRLYSNYLGASVLFQQYLDAQRKFTLSESFSAGVLFFRMENQITYPYVNQSTYNDVSNNMLIIGNTFSGKLGLTAEYRLFKDVSVGFGCNYLWGILKKASVEIKGTNDSYFSADNQDLSNALNLSRIDYSFVSRYYF